MLQQLLTHQIQQPKLEASLLSASIWLAVEWLRLTKKYKAWQLRVTKARKWARQVHQLHPIRPSRLLTTVMVTSRARPSRKLKEIWISGSRCRAVSVSSDSRSWRAARRWRIQFLSVRSSGHASSTSCRITWICGPAQSENCFRNWETRTQKMAWLAKFTTGGILPECSRQFLRSSSKALLKRLSKYWRPRTRMKPCSETSSAFTLKKSASARATRRPNGITNTWRLLNRQFRRSSGQKTWSRFKWTLEY